MKRLIATALPAILLLSIATHVAAVGPSKCSSSKLKATGKKASSRAKCYAKAVSKGDPVDSDCLAKAHDKLTSGFTKAESKGDCLAPNGDVNAIESKVDTFVNTVRNIVNSSAPGPSGCDSKKIQAAGKKASGKLKCQSKAVSKGVDVDAECLGKAEEKFSSSVSTAETANDNCTHTGQTNALESAANAFVGDATEELAPPPTTTTTTLPAPPCEAVGGIGQCGGTCPPGEVCTLVDFGFGAGCDCLPTCFLSAAPACGAGPERYHPET